MDTKFNDIGTCGRLARDETPQSFGWASLQNKRQNQSQTVS